MTVACFLRLLFWSARDIWIQPLPCLHANFHAEISVMNKHYQVFDFGRNFVWVRVRVRVSEDG